MAKKITLPEYYERVLFMGTNGSGKSKLALQMIVNYDSWVVIDSKGDSTIPGGQSYTLIKSPNDVRWKWAKRILYRPSPEYNTGEWFDEIMRRLYIRAQKTLKKKGKKITQTKPFILYVDEGLLNAKLRHTQWLAAHAVAGRSLQVGLWLSSQRPKWIPVEIRTEAWRWYVFFQSYEDDDKEVAKYTKGRLTAEELAESTGDYSFWEIRRLEGGGMSVEHFPPLKLRT